MRNLAGRHAATVLLGAVIVISGAITMWQMSRGLDRFMGWHGLACLGLAFAMLALSYAHKSIFIPALSASMSLTGWTMVALHTHAGTVVTSALAGLVPPIPLLYFVVPGLALALAIALIVLVAESVFGK